MKKLILFVAVATMYCSCGQVATEDNESRHANEEMVELTKVSTPKQKSIEEVSSFLGVTSKDVVKSIVYTDLAHNELVVVMVRGDREVNDIKVINALDIAEHELVMASYDDIISMGSVEGFVSPVGLSVKTLIDEEVAIMKNVVVGANEADYHYTNANFGRDFNGTVLDLRNVASGDLCPVCGKPLSMERGIEVGQIFKLGTKYSKAMNCTYTNEAGENVPMVMGCYGIGVTRTMSSIIEQYHDEFGIKWPLNVAPYHAVVVPVNYKDETMRTVAEELYSSLKKHGVEVVLDDRDERPGFKFKDWELIGIPYIITVGRRAGEGIIEFKNRQTMEKVEKTLDEAISIIVESVNNIR